ncbi:DUF742 domain-containing protein [Kineosporia sp. A_224]|uniref:DUF742 domain-containing protein n=1 Tax=Kineosporia sp. A_224 TaxID=1962180 RepID=UPI000B4BCCC0|nr:DUF742 domain-containing protein [Kineosporia sp. A_224]
MTDDHDRHHPGEDDVGGLWSVRPFLDRTARVQPPAAPAAPAAPDEDAATTVRPFVVTRGRTAEETDLAVEAQVVTTKLGQASVDELSFEYRDIVDLCVEPLAVAEVSARLRLQLGVAQVLLRDLTRSGHVTTFEPGVGLSDDVHTILRVIDGLRQLS